MEEYNKQYNIKGVNDANSPRTLALNELRAKVNHCQKCNSLLRLSNVKLKQGKARCNVCGYTNIFHM